MTFCPVSQINSLWWLMSLSWRNERRVQTAQSPLGLTDLMTILYKPYRLLSHKDFRIALSKFVQILLPAALLFWVHGSAPIIFWYIDNKRDNLFSKRPLSSKQIISYLKSNWFHRGSMNIMFARLSSKVRSWQASLQSFLQATNS